MDVRIGKVVFESVMGTIFDMDRAIFTKPRIHLPARNVQDIINFARGCAIYLAYDEEEPVGYVIFKSTGTDNVEITGIGVIPSYQGRGIGQQLMNKVFQNEKTSKFTLVTHPENAQSMNFYKKLGFVETGRKENYYGDGEPRVLLEKKAYE